MTKNIERAVVASVKWEETLLERRRWINRRLREERAKRRGLLDMMPDKESRRGWNQGGKSKRTKARRVPMGATIPAKTAGRKAERGRGAR